MRKKLVNKTSIKNIFIRKSTWILVAIFIVGIITIPSFISKAGSESRSVDYADEIRVLEVEPGNKFLFTAGKQTVNGQDVDVTQMTMPEFISTVDQLTGKYDAVVIARENSNLASKFNIADQTKYFDYSAPFTNHLDKAKYLKPVLSDLEAWMTLPYSYGGRTDNGRVFDEYYSENDITDRRAKDVISMIDNNQLVYIDENITNSDSLKTTKLVTNFKNKTSNIVSHSSISLSKIVADYNSNNSKRAYISKLEASGDDSNVKNIGSDGKVYGSYKSRKMEFTITVPGGADGYKANLYFDMNADGIYTENEMEDTFDLSKYYKGDKKYTISANMPEEFVGYLDWKIELVNKESGKISSYVTYYTVFKAVPGHRKGIKVLQIHPTGGDDDNALYLCPPGSDTTASQNTFNKILALKEVRDSGYDLDIHSMSATVFNEKTDADHNYLDTKKYDMIIVGFGDNYINNQLKENACNAIQKFIKDGKSCMFTHDTLTLSTFGSINDNWNDFTENNPKNGTGPKRFGQMFRDIAGQARYVDPYRNSGKKSNASNLEERDLDGSIIPHDKLPSSLGDNTYSLGTTFYMNYYNATLKTEVKNINNAQITSYPFNLSGGEIKVSQTHTQWFQLNLEDEEVVPWFNLSGSNINSGDSRNFYYTYSKGNITYSGTGHSNGYPESEMKLFVNTIIKAERGANFAPDSTNYKADTDFNDLDEVPDNQFVKDGNIDFKADGMDDFYFVSKVKDLNGDDIKVSMTAVVNDKYVSVTPRITAKSKGPNKPNQFDDTTNVFGAGSYVGGVIAKEWIQEVANLPIDEEKMYIKVIVKVEDYQDKFIEKSFKIKIKKNHQPVVTNFRGGTGKQISNKANLDEISREEDFVFDSLITDEDKDDLKEVVITLDGEEILRRENVATGDEGYKITGIIIPKKILSTKAPGATFEVVVTATDVKDGKDTKSFTLELEEEDINAKHYFVESRKEDGTIDKATITEYKTSINMQSKIEAVGYVSKIYEYNKTVKLKIDNGLKITPGTEVKLYVEANNKSVLMNYTNNNGEEYYGCTLTKDLLGNIDMRNGAKIRVEYSVDILQMPKQDQVDTRYSNILSVDKESATITIIDEKFERHYNKEYPYLF